jgi:hypothetical protein
MAQGADLESTSHVREFNRVNLVPNPILTLVPTFGSCSLGAPRI